MKLPIYSFIILIFMSSNTFAASMEDRIKVLEDTLKKQEQTIRNQQKLIEELREEIQEPQDITAQKEEVSVEKEQQEPAVRDYRLDDRSRAIALQSGTPITPYQVKTKGSPSVLNPAISVIGDFIYYNSNLSEEDRESREIAGFTGAAEEGGGHGHGQSSLEEGFNLRSAEIRIFAPVDPYFNLYVTIPFTEEAVEVEEAHFVTTSLPAGFQVKGGKFKSGFGRFNAFHPHAWNFVDAPLPYTTFLGGEGLIEKGAQVTYLPDLPVYTLIGGEMLQGANSVLYGTAAKPEPHAFTGFIKSSLDVTDNGTVLFGGSVTGGKTKTESIEHETEFRGDSILYGAEFTYKWKPSKDRSFLIQSEYLLRHQKGDFENLEDETIEGLKRTQDGLYVQALYQLGRWRVGARYDALEIFKDDYILDGVNTTFGDDPYRLTGSLEFNPTEFSRIRLQYTHDKTDRDGPDNDELFLQFIMGIGAHGAHTF
ncbi:hypothetical protein H8E50_13845 [bacterium]|nr:hypothetical protein [bacterium]